jgi:hypothetical protein
MIRREGFPMTAERSDEISVVSVDEVEPIDTVG